MQFIIQRKKIKATSFVSRKTLKLCFHFSKYHISSQSREKKSINRLHIHAQEESGINIDLHVGMPVLFREYNHLQIVFKRCVPFVGLIFSKE